MNLQQYNKAFAAIAVPMLTGIILAWLVNNGMQLTPELLVIVTGLVTSVVSGAAVYRVPNIPAPPNVTIVEPVDEA